MVELAVVDGGAMRRPHGRAHARDPTKEKRLGELEGTAAHGRGRNGRDRQAEEPRERVYRKLPDPGVHVDGQTEKAQR